MRNRSLILSAGRGSRMGTLTELKPKALTVLYGKTLLDWQLETLDILNIKKKIIVSGYKSELISGNFEKYKNDRWKDTNMVSSLFCAPKFNGSTIVSYSDIVYNSDHVKMLLDSAYDITITADKFWEQLWTLRFDNPLDDAETFIHKNGYLQEIGEKTSNISNIQAQYMGLLKLTKNGWLIMQDLFNSFSTHKQDKMDMTGMLNELIKNGINVNVIFVEGKWCEVDSHKDVLIYEKELKNNNSWKHDWR